jgi:hypothetical protein
VKEEKKLSTKNYAIHVDDIVQKPPRESSPEPVKEVEESTSLEQYSTSDSSDEGNTASCEQALVTFDLTLNNYRNWHWSKIPQLFPWVLATDTFRTQVQQGANSIIRAIRIEEAYKWGEYELTVI